MRKVKNSLVEKFRKEFDETYGSIEEETLKKQVFAKMAEIKALKQDIISAEKVVEMKKEKLEQLEEELEDME